MSFQGLEGGGMISFSWGSASPEEHGQAGAVNQIGVVELEIGRIGVICAPKGGVLDHMGKHKGTSTPIHAWSIDHTWIHDVLKTRVVVRGGAALEP